MNDAAAEAAIRALIEERVAAMHARDAARAVATLADDVVAFELAPPLALGGAAVRDAAGLEAWFAGWDGPVTIDVRDLTIAASGDVGWCHSLNRLAGRRVDGRAVDMWMRSTLGLRKVDGRWRIAHGHSSLPFMMDGSFRAATDLKP